LVVPVTPVILQPLWAEANSLHILQFSQDLSILEHMKILDPFMSQNRSVCQTPPSANVILLLLLHVECYIVSVRLLLWETCDLPRIESEELAWKILDSHKYIWVFLPTLVHYQGFSSKKMNDQDFAKYQNWLFSFLISSFFFNQSSIVTVMLCNTSV
jgi:hypothetical protein